MDNLERDALTTPAILRIALDTPLRRLFDYLPPRDAGRAPDPGVRVRVPFGRQRLIGVVHSHAPGSDIPKEKLKAVSEVLDDEPVIDARVRELLEFAAQYYHHSIGEVFAASLPKFARNGAPSRALTERWFATDTGLAALADNSLSKARRQRELLEALRDTPGISADALFNKTARLPRVAIRRPARVIGSTTVGSLQSGLYYGYLGLVDGILDRLLEEMGPQTTVVATGGLAALIGKGSKHIKHVDDLLTLDGLRLIWERNSEAKPSRDAASGKDSAASTTHGRKPRSR